MYFCYFLYLKMIYYVYIFFQIKYGWSWPEDDRPRVAKVWRRSEDSNACFHSYQVVIVSFKLQIEYIQNPRKCFKGSFLLGEPGQNLGDQVRIIIKGVNSILEKKIKNFYNKINSFMEVFFMSSLGFFKVVFYKLALRRLDPNLYTNIKMAFEVKNCLL